MKKLSMALFTVGILAGMVLVAFATWTDQEASLFEPTSVYDKGLPSLRCPLMIANDEPSEISVVLNNPSTYPVNPLTTAHITSGSVLLINEYEELPSVQPGGRTRLAWKIAPEDAAYKSLVIARIFVERSYPLPSRTGSCGVLVLPFGGIPGQAVVLGLVLMSLAGMILGLVFWRRQHTVLSTRQSGLFSGMIAIAAITVAGMLSIVVNIWLLGLACVILVLLISLALVTRYGGET